MEPDTHVIIPSDKIPESGYLVLYDGKRVSDKNLNWMATVSDNRATSIYYFDINDDPVAIANKIVKTYNKGKLDGMMIDGQVVEFVLR